jgi:hypothetical protein
VGPVVAGTARATAWAETNIPAGDAIASFAYREIAYRLDRPVVPLNYTSDMVRGRRSRPKHSRRRNLGISVLTSTRVECHRRRPLRGYRPGASGLAQV